MTEDYDIYFARKKYVHQCTLPKAAEAIDEIIPDGNKLSKRFRKFCLISRNVGYRRIYAKSNRVLDKERKAHLMNHYCLIHPFSDFSYYWGIMMIIVNLIQLTLTPIIVIQRLKMKFIHTFIFCTLIIGILNIIIQFNTGFYRYDIKEVVFDRLIIAKHYLKTFFIADLVGNFPFRLFLQFLDVDISIVIMFKMAIAFNAGNFIKCLESLREKRDMDLVIVRLVTSFAIAGIGLLWITALWSIAANLDQDYSCKSELWWSLYLNFMLIAGTSVNQFTFAGYEIYCKMIGLSFGFIIRNIILVQLILFFKTYLVNQLKKSRLLLEINEFCYLKKLPYHLRKKIFQYYDFKFQNVYYNELDIWTILSESMRQNILDYDSKQWFEGDIFKLCPLVLRQLISINLDKEIFLKGDVIYSFSDLLTRIYFIKTGTVALYEQDGNLAYLIDEGNFFSEETLFLKEGINHQPYKAVAYENCQLFSLKKELFQRIIKNFPVEYNVILDILTRRKRYLLNNKRINKRLKLADYFADTPSTDEI